MRTRSFTAFFSAAFLCLLASAGLSAQEPAEQDLLYIAEYEVASGRVMGEVIEEASGWVRALRETGEFESVRLYMHDMGPSLSVYLITEPRSWASLRQGFDEFFEAQPELFTTPWGWAGHSDNILAEIPVPGGSADAEAVIGRLRYQWEALATAGLANALDEGKSAREHGLALGDRFAGSWGESLTPEGFARGMVGNLRLVGATVEIVESGPDRVVLETTRPWAESWDPDYEEWGVSVDEYETWLQGVLDGIGAHFGISTAMDRPGDRLRIAFRG